MAGAPLVGGVKEALLVTLMAASASDQYSTIIMDSLRDTTAATTSRHRAHPRLDPARLRD